MLNPRVPTPDGETLAPENRLRLLLTAPETCDTVEREIVIDEALVLCDVAEQLRSDLATARALIARVGSGVAEQYDLAEGAVNVWLDREVWDELRAASPEPIRPAGEENA
jgi:hypothetical protein